MIFAVFPTRCRSENQLTMNDMVAVLLFQVDKYLVTVKTTRGMSFKSTARNANSDIWLQDDLVTFALAEQKTRGVDDIDIPSDPIKIRTVESTTPYELLC